MNLVSDSKGSQTNLKKVVDSFRKHLLECVQQVNKTCLTLSKTINQNHL